MTSNQSYRRLGALALMLLFVAFWSSKTLHGLLAHHHSDDEAHLICEVAHDPNTAHIHDDRWAVEDCSICAFVVSVSGAYFPPDLPSIQIKLPDTASPCFYFAPAFSKKACDSAMRRGPPAVFSA